MSEEPVAFSIKVEPGDGDDILTKFRNGIDEMRKTLPLQLEFQIIQAKITKAK